MGSTGAWRGAISGRQAANMFTSRPSQPPQQQAGTAVAAPANTTPGQDVNTNFSATDGTGFKELYNGRQYYNNQVMDIDARQAVGDYLIANPMPGSLYAPSQDLNYRLENNLPLDGNQQFMVASMNDAMHNLGYDLNLTRYGRVDYVDKFAQLAGVNINSNTYGNMTTAQLRQAFVGLQYTEKGFVSTSYNDFKNAPNGGRPFTDKAVKINIKAPASTQALMPGNGPGGALGEMLLKPGQNYRINDVRLTKKMGRSGAGSYRVIEFDVEIF